VKNTDVRHLQFADGLEIIVMNRHERWRIDDGSHWAVAMALAGKRVTYAYVGRI
jgi:hypothetical protein